MRRVRERTQRRGGRRRAAHPALRAEIGAKVQALRRKAGLTQEELAVRCARSVAFVSALERGARSPSLETLDDLARSLDVPLAELFRLAPQVAYEDPYFGKLVSFAQTARLGRRDVDRMIAVACALFGVARESVPSAPAQPTAKPVAVCAVRGCGRPPVAKGLCPSHYHRHRRLDAARA